MGYDIFADQLLLHTVQPAAVLDALLGTGVHVPDKSLVHPFNAVPYAWMQGQMAARLTTEGEGAVWFWAQIGRRDLVDFCRQAKGEVLFTCKVPREQVLLSHFGDWHAVLNRRPHVPDLPGESDAEYRARFEQVLDDFEERLRTVGGWGAEITDWPADLRSEVEQGWQPVLEPAHYGRFESWQATTHVLRAENVVEAVRFV
ncbi:hypothetical protein GCM10023063_18280 [Arthrobacter methylotrophus]|uniref:DUF3841 domain-containing protein n=1 Tax=Arthrobacter methylotrophus TaxID=121291 RepID=A0ABV5URQ1_9MICC